MEKNKKQCFVNYLLPPWAQATEPGVSITCILWTACPYPITPHMGDYPLITLTQGPDLNY